MAGGASLAALALAALLSACTAQAGPDTPVSSDDPPLPIAQPVGPTADCPISSSSDWTAWVNAMPGPQARPTLIVIGKVVVPSGGYRVTLVPGPVMEIHPPIQQVEVRAVPPAREGPPIVETFEVRAELAALPEYGAVQVRCGSRTLASLSDIVRAH